MAVRSPAWLQTGLADRLLALEEKSYPFWSLLWRLELTKKVLEDNQRVPAAFLWLQPAGANQEALNQESKPDCSPPPAAGWPSPDPVPQVLRFPAKAPATAYHGFQAADLVLCPIEQLFPVPLLLEQQLGPSAGEVAASALARVWANASFPTMPLSPLPRKSSLLFPAIPQQLPGQRALPLQLLRYPLLVLPQLVPLLLQLLGRGKERSPLSGCSCQLCISLLSPSMVRKGQATLSDQGLCHPQDVGRCSETSPVLHYGCCQHPARPSVPRSRLTLLSHNLAPDTGRPGCEQPGLCGHSNGHQALEVSSVTKNTGCMPSSTFPPSFLRQCCPIPLPQPTESFHHT